MKGVFCFHRSLLLKDVWKDTAWMDVLGGLNDAG